MSLSDSKIELTWKFFEAFQDKTELLNQLIEKFIIIFQKKYLTDKIYRYLNKYQINSKDHYKKKFYETFIKTEFVSLEFFNESLFKDLRRSSFKSNKRKSLVGDVDPLTSLIEISQDFQNSDIFHQILTKVYSLKKNEKE